MNRFKFKLTIRGTQLGAPISFEKISPRFKNIELIPINDYAYELIVTKRNIGSLETIQEEAVVEANNLIDRLSLIDNHNISDLTFEGFTNDNEQFIPQRGHSGLTANLTALISDPVKFYEQERNLKLLLNTKNSGAVRTYRSALGIKDEISQYLIFYGLLLILIGETQKQVDDYIQKEIPDILIVKGKYSDETIITNIRNTIAHPKDGLDMGDLTKKVHNYLVPVQKIVLELLRSA